MPGHSVPHLHSSLSNTPKMSQANFGINFLCSGPPCPPNTFNLHLQTFVQSPGDPEYVDRARVIFFFFFPDALPASRALR